MISHPLVSEINELRELREELKLRRKNIGVLVDRTRQLENSITSYMEEHNEVGLQVNGQTIELKMKPKVLLKPKKEKLESCGKVLSDNGVTCDPLTLMDLVKKAGINRVEEKATVVFKKPE